MGKDNSHATWKQKTMEAFEAYRINGGGHTWANLKDKINRAISEMINSGITLGIKAKVDRKGWQKVIEGKAKWFNETKYEDLYKVYEYIAQDNVKNNNSIANIEEINTEWFTYYTTKFQDTILPYLYKDFYKKEFTKLSFEIDKDWNEILYAFNSEDKNVALHNYSTALAITRSVKGNPAMFFFPFFLFKGYGIVVKKSSVDIFCTKSGIKNNGFNKLSPDNKKTFLEESTTTLEPKTDVEWIYKNYCVKYDADWDTVKAKIKSFDVNEGKKRFVLKSGTDIYCTNSIHLADLGKQPDKYEIIKSDEVTKHKNVNGLLCTMDFFNKNSSLIKKLILTWYHHIVEFIKEKEEILHNPNVAPFTSDLLKGFNHSLNDYTYSTLSLHELMISYKTNNEFFIDAAKAFNEFYTEDFVVKHTADKSFWKIANVQLGKEEEEEANMLEIISTLYTNMKDAFTKINNG